MNRTTLFLSALVLGGTMVQARSAEHPQANSGGSKATMPAHPQESHATEKCGHCGGSTGRAQTPATPGKKADHATHSGAEHHDGNAGKNTFGKDGHVLEAHGHGVDDHHDRDGEHERHRELRDNPELSRAHEHHYAERSYSFRGHDFDHRTYYIHGVAYSRFYQHYYYHGIAFHVYAPGFYYSPFFYGWAYNPWAVPVAWEWGWRGYPWFRYYGARFTPYPVYSSPSLWLTDYMVAETLRSAYEERIAALAAAQQNAEAANFSATRLTPEVKQAIAEEVRRQLALENSEAAAGSQIPPDPGSSGLARMLGDHMAHVFVAASDVMVSSNTGTCSLTEGDVIQLSGPTAPASVTANVLVLASKGSDCRKGSMVAVGLADLQEMQNHMRATLDQGLAELHSKQGKNGMPAAPPAAVKPPVQTAFAAIAPPPDPNGDANHR